MITEYKIEPPKAQLKELASLALLEDSLILSRFLENKYLNTLSDSVFDAIDSHASHILNYLLEKWKNAQTKDKIEIEKEFFKQTGNHPVIIALLLQHGIPYDSATMFSLLKVMMLPGWQGADDTKRICLGVFSKDIKSEIVTLQKNQVEELLKIAKELNLKIIYSFIHHHFVPDDPDLKKMAKYYAKLALSCINNNKDTILEFAINNYYKCVAPIINNPDETDYFTEININLFSEAIQKANPQIIAVLCNLRLKASSGVANELFSFLTDKRFDAYQRTAILQYGFQFFYSEINKFFEHFIDQPMTFGSILLSNRAEYQEKGRLYTSLMVNALNISKSWKIGINSSSINKIRQFIKENRTQLESQDQGRWLLERWQALDLSQDLSSLTEGYEEAA